MLLPGSAASSACFENSEVLDDLKDHLLIAPLSVWMDVLHRSDLDDHLDLVAWMIAQPECDLTLAQLAFYRCRPRLAIRKVDGVSEALARESDLCADIAARYHAGQYTRRELALRPGELTKQIMALRTFSEITPNDARRFDIPAAFLEEHCDKLTALQDVWSADHSDEIWTLYDAAGLRVPAAKTPMEERAPSSVDNSVLSMFTDMMLRPAMAAT